jgi:hypothetical protein
MVRQHHLQQLRKRVARRVDRLLAQHDYLRRALHEHRPQVVLRVRQQ